MDVGTYITSFLWNMFSKRWEVITAQTFSCFGIDAAWPTDRLAEKMGIVLEEENPGCGGQRFSSTVLKAGFTSGESPKYELWLKNSVTRKRFLFYSMPSHFTVLQNSGNIKFPQFHTRKTELKTTRKKKNEPRASPAGDSEVLVQREISLLGRARNFSLSFWFIPQQERFGHGLMEALRARPPRSSSPHLDPISPLPTKPEHKIHSCFEQLALSFWITRQPLQRKQSTE